MHSFNAIGLRFNKYELIYMSITIFIQLFYSIIQPILFKKYQFLPLIMFSVYCAIGFIYFWYKLYLTFYEYYNLVNG